MTKPGHHPWADNDTYVSGPDAGSNTKTAPLAAHREDGYYRSRRPGPDILNHQLNRSALMHESVARMQASNYTEIYTDSTDLNGGRMVASAHGVGASSDAMAAATIFRHSLSTNLVYDSYSHAGTNWTTGGTVISGVTTATTAADADCDEGSHRVFCLTYAGGTDKAAYSSNPGGAWSAITFSGGAPGYDWYSVACDRNTAGNASAHWCIGGFGSTDGRLWSSADGVTFSAESGFATGNIVRGVYHSCHQTGALGPDDSGNPVWLAQNNVGQIYYSTDHTTWTTGGVELLGKLQKGRSLAYSKPSRRWVAAQSGVSFGNISYSDDNGASWTTMTGALPILATMANASTTARIAGDGYGTFVVIRDDQPTVEACYAWVSVDEGLTWSMFTIANAITGDDGHLIEGCFYEGGTVDGTDPGLGFFFYAAYNDGTPETKVYRSMVV